jgi:phasin protein
MSQLSSAKDPAKPMEVQSEYIKNGYETSVAESKRRAELHADLFGSGSEVAPVSGLYSLRFYGVSGQQLGKFFVADLGLRNQNAALKVFD